ncbi:calcium-binding protein [Shimia thalassica]|uniref:calcium-binding protein n=1 Tax=Shimia thalassica TaxID=1715693 RepID=UPI002732D8B6|nr:hypothetical protein [Shimia thalassica]MDP2517511.1 hypothetical protein [Shimia thalassica]
MLMLASLIGLMMAGAAAVVTFDDDDFATGEDEEAELPEADEPVSDADAAQNLVDLVGEDINADLSSDTAVEDAPIQGVSDQILSGNTQHEVIDGDSGDDQINGYAGDDTLAGGAGEDHLYGNDGDFMEMMATTSCSGMTATISCTEKKAKTK